MSSKSQKDIEAIRARMKQREKEQKQDARLLTKLVADKVPGISTAQEMEADGGRGESSAG